MIKQSSWLICIAQLAESSRLRLPDSLRTDSAGSEWSKANILGLAGIVLVVLLLALSLFHSGTGKSWRVRIHQVVAASEAELTAVLKLNSPGGGKPEILPVHASVREDVKGCEFALPKEGFETSSISLIVREGNVPVHFATITGKALATRGQPAGGKARQRLALGTLQDTQNLVSLIFEIR